MAAQQQNVGTILKSLIYMELRHSKSLARFLIGHCNKGGRGKSWHETCGGAEYIYKSQVPRCAIYLTKEQKKGGLNVS